jgi:hypothetical protein
LIIQSFKSRNWLWHKSVKSHTFDTCKRPRLAKNKTFSQNLSLKINPLHQLITKLAYLMQHRRRYKTKYWCILGPLMIPITMLWQICIVMFAERQDQILLAKSNLSLEKCLNVKLLFIIIKLKVWNMKIVSMWYQKNPIPQLS